MLTIMGMQMNLPIFNKRNYDSGIPEKLSQRIPTINRDHHMKQLASLLLGLMISLCSFSQESWDLEKCITHAIENNLNVRSGTLAVQTAEANLRQSKLAMLPNLNASANGGLGFGRVTTADNITTSAPVSFSNSLSLNTGIVLFNGMQIRNNIQLSELGREISMLDQKALQENIVLEVAGNYLEVLLAMERQRLATTQLNLSTANLENSEKLSRAGVIPEGDLRALEAQVANDELTIINENNNVELALLNLKLSMQLDPNEDITVETPPDELLNSVLGEGEWSTSEIYAYASRSLATYVSNERSLESAAKQVDLAKGGLYPTLSLGGSLSTQWFRTSDEFAGFFVDTTGMLQGVPWPGYTDQLDGNFAQQVGLSLNIPIFNNGTVKRNVELAEIDYQRTQYFNEIELNTLRQTITQAVANANASKKSYEASLKLVEARRQELAFAESRFNAGRSNSFEFNNTRNQLTLSEVQLIQAKYQYIFAVKILDFYQGKPVTF